VIQRRSRREDFATYLEIMAAQQVTLLVVGLPTKTDGSDSDTAVWIREYMAEFSPQTRVPIVFWDESYTTVQAEDSLRLRGKRGKQVKERVDAVAAAFILQSYLDAHAAAESEVLG
jgi:putative Holliday junction resolvase